MGEKRESRLITCIIAVLAATVVLTGSVAVPILCRTFYYAHIEPLQISESIGLTEDQIRQTYNEIMDYCLGMTDMFELNYLPWSAEGAAHFTDVQKLFMLDIRVAATSLILLAAMVIISRLTRIRPARIKRHTAGFWAAASLGTVCIVLSALTALDFDAAFTAFHSIFFPGKDNWLFDPAVDPVIDMLPQVFFRNCALLAVALIIMCCIILILTDRYYRNSKRCHQR